MATIPPKGTVQNKRWPSGITTYVTDTDVTLTKTWQLFTFGCMQAEWDLWNDTPPLTPSPLSPMLVMGYIEWSWDGITVAGRIYEAPAANLPGEHWREWLFTKSGVYLRGQHGGESYRMWTR